MDTYTTSKTGKSLCIYSYNSRGFAQEKQDLCKIMMSTSGNTYPILCNQENFLLRSNGYKIKKCLPKAHVIFKKAEKDTHDNGRPKNGMFIAVPTEIKEFIKDISPNNWRVQAVLVHAKDNTILIINTYFPTDPKTQEFDTSELMITLSTIQELLSRDDFNSVIWAGDINAEFSRKTQFTKCVESFIDDNNFKTSWANFPIDFTHVQELNGKSYTSIIDHFMWSENLDETVTDAGVLHLVNNFSDHCPIYCQLPITELNKIPDKPINFVKKPSWSNASDEEKTNYLVSLESSLNELEVSNCLLNCGDVHCCDKSHQNECDNLMINILESIDKLSMTHLTPKKRNHAKKKKDPIASWETDIEPFKRDAQFWHSIWISAGRPLNTELHKVMKRTRNIYHLQIRKCKKAADMLKRNKLLDACLNGKGDIYTEIRKMRKSPESVVNTIDGVSSNIPDHFASIYSKLYNSVDEINQLNVLLKSTNELISDKNIEEIKNVTPEIVRKATERLKKKRNDPTHRFTSDCLINAPQILFEQLAVVFQSYLLHSHVTDMLLLSSLVPLVKDKLGSLFSSDNYRSIAISSLILKIFDWVIIILSGDKLQLDELQFGYQENSSTNMCTWMAVETIDHFMRNGSDVFVCVMDMKKAFDTVQHSVLFQKLLGRKIPATYVRLLMVMYGSQYANVKWNGSSSANFPIKNGVKQGAVLSAILFCIYINDLFNILRRNRTGCWIQDQFCGMLGYADDIMLISPTLEGLQEMINGCADYMSLHNLTFSTNPDPKKCKTKCLAFTSNNQREFTPLKLNGNDLPWVSSTKHLGTKIENCYKGASKDLMEKRAIFINRNNELIQEFQFAHPHTIIRTNNIFNTSMYGCVLWDLFGKEAERMEKTWNISQRLMLGLHRESHRYFIEPVSGTSQIIFHMYRRFVTFIESLLNSKKMPLRVLCHEIFNDARSTTGRNIRQLMLRLNAGTFKELKENIKIRPVYHEALEEDMWKIAAVKDLIDAKYDRTILPGFTSKEIDSIRDYLTTI